MPQQHPKFPHILVYDDNDIDTFKALAKDAYEKGDIPSAVRLLVKTLVIGKSNLRFDLQPINLDQAFVRYLTVDEALRSLRFHTTTKQFRWKPDATNDTFVFIEIYQTSSKGEFDPERRDEYHVICGMRRNNMTLVGDEFLFVFEKVFV